MIEITIPLRSHDEAIQVLGPYDRNAKLLRQSFDIEIYTRGGNLRLKGNDAEANEVRQRVEHLLGKLRKGRRLEPADVEAILLAPARDGGTAASITTVRHALPDPAAPIAGVGVDPGLRPGAGSHLGLRSRAVEPRGKNQARYLDSMEESTLTFGVGVAGTGKTFLAVAAAVRALRAGTVRRLIISRPVVEAGEHLGFLPGDLQAKLNPYLRPVYDSLFELIGFEDTRRLEEAGIIEIAPLAYMRGRTLSHAFVVLDEAQNTTAGQMKMFLTRLGEGSTMVVTGDPTQSDLEDRGRNGFIDAIARLRGFQGISVVEFSAKDIVRHPLVEQIVRAYEAPGAPRGPASRR